MTVKFCKYGILLLFLYLNAVSVYLLPGVEIVLYIKDHNGNKFYFKLCCVILEELSVFTTLFFCQIKRKKERNNLQRQKSHFCPFPTK